MKVKPRKSIVEYFNTLLKEAGCESRWELDTDTQSNSFGTWFCGSRGGVNSEKVMRQHTHNLLATKAQYPNHAV